MSVPAVRSVLRYPGGKARLAPWIVSHMPPHHTYVEPFFGGGSVFFVKPRSRIEVLSDLDHRVVNLFRVLRERPEELARAVTLTPYARAEYDRSDEPTDDVLEAARRFLVRVWFAHGGKLGSKSGWRQGWAGGSDATRSSSAGVWRGVPDRIAAVAERLRDAVIDCRPALEVIAEWHEPGALLYVDPPYVRSTLGFLNHDGGRKRRGERPRYYAHEMTDEDHAALLSGLLRHPGPVLLSGYRNPLYDEALAGWQRVDRVTLAYRQARRVESLWLSPAAQRRDLFSLAGVEAPA